ncbi:MAG: hypothetical protein ACLR7M_01805 [Varibaculum timonense]|uniref:hypothetical protein n=1 Tax=Varibaculum timonense TaxID=1964383 RepID=UPI0022DFFCFD|nr:hypothetical protein [Varibaculum timonense]
MLRHISIIYGKLGGRKTKQNKPDLDYRPGKYRKVKSGQLFMTHFPHLSVAK